MQTRNKTKITFKSVLLMALVFIGDITKTVTASLNRPQMQVNPLDTFDFEYGDQVIALSRDEKVTAAEGCVLETAVAPSHEYFNTHQLCGDTAVITRSLSGQVQLNRYLASRVVNGEITLSESHLPASDRQVKAVSFNTKPGVYRKIYNAPQNENKLHQAELQPTIDSGCVMTINQVSNGGQIVVLHDQPYYQNQEGVRITCARPDSQNLSSCLVDFNPKQIKPRFFNGGPAEPKRSGAVVVDNEFPNITLTCHKKSVSAKSTTPRSQLTQ